MSRDSRFVPILPTVVLPMSQLLRKGRRWERTSEQQEAFDRMKILLTEAPVLACLDFSREFVLQMDASEYGIGG